MQTRRCSQHPLCRSEGEEQGAVSWGLMLGVADWHAYAVPGHARISRLVYGFSSMCSRYMKCCFLYLQGFFSPVVLQEEVLGTPVSVHMFEYTARCMRGC